MAPTDALNLLYGHKPNEWRVCMKEQLGTEGLVGVGMGIHVITRRYNMVSPSSYLIMHNAAAIFLNEGPVR